MQIHSSSLSYTPASYNNKSNQNDENKQDVLNQKPEPSVQEAVNKTPRATDLNQLTDTINKQSNSQKNLRITQALNAYVNVNTEPLKAQRADLIARIDLFV